MDTTLSNLLIESDTHKRSHFLELSPANHTQNSLKVKNVLKQLKVKEGFIGEITSLLTNPHVNRSLALYSEQEVLKYVVPMYFPYQGEFGYNRYYILPLLDFRNRIFNNLFLLMISRHSVVLYKVMYSDLKEVRLRSLRSFKLVTSYREEVRAIQHHSAEQTTYHGQNAANMRDNEADIFNSYLLEVANVLNNFLTQHQAKVILAGTQENCNSLKHKLDANFVSELQIPESYEKRNASELLEEIHNQLNNYSQVIIKNVKKNIDVDESNELSKKPFAQIISLVKQGQIAEMYIGELGEFDIDYTNPIAPLGANYIAHEVLKLGGKVSFLPGYKFEFSENNIAYKFRF